MSGREIPPRQLCGTKQPRTVCKSSPFRWRRSRFGTICVTDKTHWQSRSRRELAHIKERRKYHLKAAKTHWNKAKTEGISPELAAEHEKITQFISAWAQIYPNRFYHYGIYPSFFKVEQEIFKKRGDYAAVLSLEADAAEMCADQYNEITVTYFRAGCSGLQCSWTIKGGDVAGEAISHHGENHLSIAGEDCVMQYEKVRDTHRQRAALLRKIAEGKPKTFPIEAEAVLRDLSHKAISPAPKLTSVQALGLADRAARLQEHLKAHTGVCTAYASFQGFAWFVSYCNHGWGNLGIVLVDDGTGTVLDVLIVDLRINETFQTEPHRPQVR